MSYQPLAKRLASGGVVILDGGTGTELERRGVPMDAEAWCGPASFSHGEVLEVIHRDYIEAGADVITANTFASSRLMLRSAGLAEQAGDINRSAIEAALRARESAGRKDIAVAGSLSHMLPLVAGTTATDLDRLPSRSEMADAFGELAELHMSAGCDLILLEMMCHPDRMSVAFEAATATGLPVWAGFSVRRGPGGGVLSFALDRDIPFAEILTLLDSHDVAAAGIMHSPSDIVAEAVAILKPHFNGPLTAYPDSGYFRMPDWQFEDIITPNALHRFASGWIAEGVQVVGGCCGLSPEHIAAIAPLRG